DFLSEIRSLDTDNNSPLHTLCNAIENRTFELDEDFLEVLKYVDSLLRTPQVQKKKKSKKYTALVATLKKQLKQNSCVTRQCSNLFLECVKTVGGLNVLRDALFNQNVRVGQDL